MNENRYLLPALSSIALAVLFPLYWINQFVQMGESRGVEFYNDLVGLNFADAVFLLVGILMVYVYVSLKKFLNDRYGFSGANIPLTLIMISVTVYVLVSLASDTFMQITGHKLHLTWHKAVLEGNATALLISTVIFGALDMVLGIMLFIKARKYSAVLTAFAILTVMQGFFELTIFLSPAVFVIYPLALIVLAVMFLRQPEALEIV
jgi:hypothetical protein